MRTITRQEWEFPIGDDGYVLRTSDERIAMWLRDLIAERDTLLSLLAETVADHDQMKHVFGTDLLGRIYAALQKKKG
jgi:hypothetical protein